MGVTATVQCITQFGLLLSCDYVLKFDLNGMVAFDANTVGSQANYSCSESYVLNGITTRICQADGQWSGSEPTCEG